MELIAAIDAVVAKHNSQKEEKKDKKHKTTHKFIKNMDGQYNNKIFILIKIYLSSTKFNISSEPMIFFHTW